MDLSVLLNYLKPDNARKFAKKEIKQAENEFLNAITKEIKKNGGALEPEKTYHLADGKTLTIFENTSCKMNNNPVDIENFEQDTMYKKLYQLTDKDKTIIFGDKDGDGIMDNLKITRTASKGTSAIDYQEFRAHDKNDDGKFDSVYYADDKVCTYFDLNK